MVLIEGGLNVTDDPDHKEENEKLLDEFIDYERKIGEYMEDCKNEFFDLFKEHFFDLWY